MPNIINKLRHLALVLVLAPAAFFRFWAAPLSAGPDVSQFWAFAKVFQLHGLDFYRYADGTAAIFPFKGWGFVYPPVWLLSSRLSLMAAPLSSATNIMVDSSWRLAMKTPIIAADLAIGCLLYWAVPGSKARKLLFASLWLLHPTAWYESAVFGQFDAIAAAFLLASIILLARNRDWLAFLFAGLAVMTKQHTLIPIALMVVIVARQMSWQRLTRNLAIIAGVVILLSIPFLLTGNFSAYASSIFLPGQAPGYQIPLVYAFSGSGALLTYLHDVFGWETSGILPFTIPIMLLAILAVAVLSYRRSITLAQGALVGYLIFIGLFYRINYQYLIIYIPLALLVAAQTQYRGERIFTIVLALFPAVWLWLFDVSFWFNYLSPTSPWATPILASIGLTHRGLPDVVFVSFALLLMALSLAYVVCVFTRWHDKGEGEGELSLNSHLTHPKEASASL
jgi:hypothetical protein